MNGKQSHSRSERWLARQLRDAARRDRPDFSESLHERIIQSVRPRVAIAKPRRYWPTAARLGAAAAVVVIAVAARSLVDSAKLAGENKTPVAVATSVGSSSPTGNGSSAVPNSNSLAANYTLDDLSRDAKATAHLLVDQLPFETPADDWGL